MSKRVVIIFFAAAILIFLYFFQNQVKDFFYSLSYPFQKTLFGAADSFSDFFQGIFQGKNLKIENEELRKKVNELLAGNAELAEVKNENKILRESLRAYPRSDFELFVSQFTGRAVDSRDAIYIKGGTKNGIKAGAPVITPEKVLVGKINRSYDNFSEVLLISAENFNFDVKIQRGENFIFGLARGMGKSALELDKVQLQVEINEKDVLITAQLGNIFPEGLLVGEIKKVKKSDTEPFLQAEVSPFFDAKELKTLFVITKW